MDDSLIHLLHFKYEETEGQERELTCPRPHSWLEYLSGI